ncbi:MAG TPA: type VI secretion system-associated FHA domain protein TagH [Steroidobacteraceae bacterium]|nr:type VI secretion system-associated FHA domain protein TagH [Steroidobacteraceae bacterium]
MILTLEVSGEQAEDLGAGSRRVFNAIGGTIGRLPDNDWVFPDPYVSGRHALIRYLNGKFFVEDTSTNGVFINTPDNRLARDQPHQLKSGDTIFIDAYRIQVSIESPAASEKQKDDPFELLKSRAREDRANRTVAMSPKSMPEDDRTAAMVRSRDESSVEWIGIDMENADTKAKARSAPPPPPPAKRAAPAPTRSSLDASRGEVAAKSNSAPAQNDDLLRAAMAAAGIQGVEPTPELAQTLGSVLRAAVAGLMDVLRGRERMKDDMRVRGTTFKPQDNNPLKFSANVDDAFHNLLVKQNAAYLSPPEAFEDALRDVREHQAAMIAAMRLTFESMLAHFDPNQLQEEFDRQMKKGSILGVPAKLRYWDLFRDKYGELAKDGDASFRTLFAEEFAKAYEEQLGALGRNRQK